MSAIMDYPPRDSSSGGPDSPGRRSIDPLDEQPMSPSKERKNVYKNIILISIAFLLNFNAYQGLARLQSTLHKDDGMGVINQSVLYGSLVISCFFMPKLIINLVGHKWTIPLSFVGYILWMAANGYAVWGTMIPASILVGLAAAPLWTAQCSYFTLIGSRYAKLNDETEEVVVSRFFGIFFCFFQLSGITGSIISATILRPTSNHTVDEDTMMMCGQYDCPWNNVSNPNLANPDETTVWSMLGVYIAIACCAVLLVVFFVDPLPPSVAPRDNIKAKDILNLVATTAKHLRHKEQLILIPLTMYSGFEQAFYAAEFSLSFVSCSAGIWKVGLVTIGFGVVNAIVSFVSGRVVKYTGRFLIFLSGFLVDLAIQVTLMSWIPEADTEYALFILAAMWGYTDAIWQTQINALYGVIFIKESEAAFSNYRMWESFGFIISFAYSNFVCTSIKLYILTSVLCIGMFGYCIVEWMVGQSHASNKRKNKPELNRDLSNGVNGSSSFANGVTNYGTTAFDEEPTVKSQPKQEDGDIEFSTHM